MSQSLSRWQAALLGFVVLGALGLGGYGLVRIAHKQGLWADTFEVSVGFAEAHDLTPGTPVRIRGVDAGQVVGVDYPDHDGPGAEVTVRLRLQSKYRDRLYRDASARIHGSGVFGAKVIAISPGTPKSGPLENGRLAGVKPFNLDEAAADLRDTAKEVKGFAKSAKETTDEAKGLVQDVRTGNGTVSKLLRDDDLYQDLKDLAADAQALVKRTDKAVSRVEGEMDNLKGFVSDGRDTLRSVKQGTDAIGKMPLIRGYVENAPALLVRPAHNRDQRAFHTHDLFEPGTAALTDAGREHLNATGGWIQELGPSAEVVVVSYCDPEDKSQTPASAVELTKKQSELVIEHFKANGIHKLGWTTRRKMTPLGMGMNPSPVVEPGLAASRVQVIAFTPR